MESALLEIFRGSYEPRAVPDPSLEGYQEAREACEKAWDELEKALGTKVREELWYATADESFYDHYADFRSGFRLGAFLMLELLDK